ncbi:hypothetical protein KBA84_03955 [Patescibacteria group bacterium]|nr:hypothetical protein [Patescibacteria group bacterium]
MIICCASRDSPVAADIPTSPVPVARLSTCHGILLAILCVAVDILLVFFFTVLFIFESISSDNPVGFNFVAWLPPTKLRAKLAIFPTAHKSFASSGLDFSNAFH